MGASVYALLPPTGPFRRNNILDANRQYFSLEDLQPPDDFRSSNAFGLPSDFSLFGASLQTERVGAMAFAAIGRAADLHVADLAFEFELAQRAICVLLKKEIAARGGADAPRQKNPAAMPNPKCNLQRTITFARRNQTRLSDMIEEAVLQISI